ncbi:Surfactin synthase thioesterase subunit [Micromonospora matsumotoense]|uniref:Surfactin synthase thioesterase subunit n=1 Tax=Micromonospora matsumotoense TaxID=121616 RepID=A0A1C5AWZ4_9ACTN|nr:alpha/beta fold hydrolase [Micromonospora matsumotoense]SCF49738.1 Surfactin synthase thioesterase subunit [Micromonospora matsumotoense]
MTTEHVTSAAQRWFVSARPRPDAPVRLLALPHAGGSAAAYIRWAELLPPEVDLAVVQLPGRQDRRSTSPFVDSETLVNALYDVLEENWDGRPYALFGHSMGALLAYRLTGLIDRIGGPRPVLLAVSGWAPAAHRTSDRAVEMYSDDELIDAVGAFGALPPELVADPQLRELVMPVLRADFSVLNSFVPDGAPVGVPVVAYAGADDPALPPGAMAGWAALTPDLRGVTEFPGGHFALFEHAMTLTADLTRQLRRLVAKPE